MKYIIFKTRSQFMPVIIPDHVTHSMVKLDILEKETEIASAGHFTVNRNGIVVSSDISTSLNIGPNEVLDKKLLEDTLGNSGMYAFIYLAPTLSEIIDMGQKNVLELLLKVRGYLTDYDYHLKKELLAETLFNYCENRHINLNDYITSLQ